jgi:hypothetical protein
MGVRVDWTYGADHMWDAHKVTVAEANEALNDVDAVWFNPDPKSKSERSIRVIGYSRSRQQILTIILVVDLSVDWLWGANGWPSNDTDRAKYGEGNEW